jgi:glycerol-3-phosphate acyltransferase PlsX
MIAIDAMGGDFAPTVVVQGAIRAAQKGISLTLFGDQIKVIPLLNQFHKQWQQLPILFEHCTQTITMEEEPGIAVLRKKDSSLVRAMQTVAAGKAHAFVSAGNSGAVLVASTIILGRVSGVLRPAIGSFLPTNAGSFFCLDLGANVDCKSEFLAQFGSMGHAYVQVVQYTAKPRIALLSNGHEPYKGSLAVKQAYQLLADHPDFIGNIEARDIFDDRADVLVCDGFAGNVLLKAIQGTARTMMSWVTQEAKKSWIRQLLLWCNAGLFRGLKQKVDYARIGGALLLGVNYPVILAHGCSHAGAIENAILFAHEVVKDSRILLLNKKLQTIFKKEHSETKNTHKKTNELIP